MNSFAQLSSLGDEQSPTISELDEKSKVSEFERGFFEGKKAGRGRLVIVKGHIDAEYDKEADTKLNNACSGKIIQKTCTDKFYEYNSNTPGVYSQMKACSAICVDEEEK